MDALDIIDTSGMPAWARVALYLIDNVIVAMFVGVAIFLVEQRIEAWRERAARRVAADQLVHSEIAPLLKAIRQNTPAVSALANKAALEDGDADVLDSCQRRQADEIARLRDAREFNEAAFAPYANELDALEQAMDALMQAADEARANGMPLSAADFLALQERLREAGKALSNKSSVAVHAR